MPHRKMRKQIKDDWRSVDELETGDRIMFEGEVIDLRASRGRNERATGRLLAYPVKKPHKDAKPEKTNGIWYWVW